MKTHVLLVDPLENLSVKKDTTLLLAATLQKLGHIVRLIFVKDFSYTNIGPSKLTTYSFVASFSKDVGYLESFSIDKKVDMELSKSIIFHFRVDPPFDTAYLRLLLILKGLKEKTGMRVINDPETLCSHNEKMIAYEFSKDLPSFVGSSQDNFNDFCKGLVRLGHDEMILKPLDLYQGIGVEKCTIEKASDLFLKKVAEFEGAIVAQPFIKEVVKGEKRAIYFAGEFIGAILKVPKKDDFLTNIAQGATFEACELTAKESFACQKITESLDIKKVPWVAFDLLGEIVQEANITCPGLLNEVSFAHGKNLAQEIVEILSE